MRTEHLVVTLPSLILPIVAALSVYRTRLRSWARTLSVVALPVGVVVAYLATVEFAAHPRGDQHETISYGLSWIHRFLAIAVGFPVFARLIGEFADALIRRRRLSSLLSDRPSLEAASVLSHYGVVVGILTATLVCGSFCSVICRNFATIPECIGLIEPPLSLRVLLGSFFVAAHAELGRRFGSVIDNYEVARVKTEDA